MKADALEYFRLKDAEALILRDIDNWVRWGRRKDYLPRSFKCPLGNLYQAGRRQDNFQDKPLPIDNLAAEAFENLIVQLHWKQRMAFVMYHLERAIVGDRVISVRNRQNRAQLIGVGVNQYQELLRRAHNQLYRWVSAPAQLT